MKSATKLIAKNSIIVYHDILSLPDIVFKFKNSGIKEIIHWPCKKISLMECSSERNLRDILVNLKSNSSIQFRIFRVNKEIRRISASKLTDAIKSIKSSVNYTEIDQSSSVLVGRMKRAMSLSDQISIFYDFKKLSECDMKLRRCYEFNIDRIVKRIIPSGSVQIIGSSVNGLGKSNSDLDMKIVFRDTQFSASESVEILRNLRTLLKRFNPYIGRPDVYNCRFPICHYYDEVLNLNVDLSILPDTSFEMVRLIKRLSESYEYFAPLCMAAKQIYTHQRVLGDGPNKYFTGFKIVSLIIHFLQSHNFLSPLKSISSLDQSGTVHQSPDLGQLLIDFFQYMIDFNPELYHIDLGNGTLNSKRQDPFLLCTSHLDCGADNITRNITGIQWDIFTGVNRRVVKLLSSDNGSRGDLRGLVRFLDF